jgi:type I site-specific restriction-modification system R (restriction) subunit
MWYNDSALLIRLIRLRRRATGAAYEVFGVGFTEEVTIKEKSERRPDPVVYINGIAVAVIKLKKSTVSVSQGIRQNLSNQHEHFNRPFFTTLQFIMAGNSNEGLRYGTIETPEKYYLEWYRGLLILKLKKFSLSGRR